MKGRRSALWGLLCLIVAATTAAAADPASAVDLSTTTDHKQQRPVVTEQYRLQPGDLLTVSVWKEKDLEGDVLVRPDGGLSFPLAGDMEAAGHTVEEVRATLVQRLKPYIPDPVVTVIVRSIGGNHVYVIGKVQRPGEFIFARPLDVMQALSLAGGATPYAALNDIVILRRENGVERVLRFRYGDIVHGRSLEQNVVLVSGDTVVVP